MQVVKSAVNQWVENACGEGFLGRVDQGSHPWEATSVDIWMRRISCNKLEKLSGRGNSWCKSPEVRTNLMCAKDARGLRDRVCLLREPTCSPPGGERRGRAESRPCGNAWGGGGGWVRDSGEWLRTLSEAGDRDGAGSLRNPRIQELLLCVLSDEQMWWLDLMHFQGKLSTGLRPESSSGSWSQKGGGAVAGTPAFPFGQAEFLTYRVHSWRRLAVPRHVWVNQGQETHVGSIYETQPLRA